MQFELQIMRFFSHRASSHARCAFSEKGRRFGTQPMQREVRSGHAVIMRRRLTRMRECISSGNRSQFTDNTVRTPDHGSLRQAALPYRLCGSAYSLPEPREDTTSRDRRNMAKSHGLHTRAAKVHDAWHNLCTLS